MGSKVGVAGSRTRWLLAFTVVLLISSAVPVFAAEQTGAPSSESEEVEFTPRTSQEEEIAAAQIPDAADIYKALAEREDEEQEREEWLASPEAIQQREDSLLAFTGLAAGEAEQLLRTVFQAQLEALNGDPSRFLSDAQLVRPVGDSDAIVKDEGDGLLMDSTVPVQAEDEDGDLAKVDLTLEATAEGFEPDNALVDLALPASADQAIEVGEEGFAIAQAGAADSPARRYGDKNLFYASVLPDTDLLVTVNSFGAELFDLLRSEDSPEEFRFAIDVPAGAELRSDQHGGAEVVRDGEILTRIPSPSAVDAQQTEVPVTLEIDGSSIVLHVAHRGGDYAHPILLDPIIQDGNNWYEGKNLDLLTNGAWKWTSNNGNIAHDVCCWGGTQPGLLTTVQDAFYGPEQYGQWSYSTANAAVLIVHAWMNPFLRVDNGCGSQQPHDYVGLWNPGDQWHPILTDEAKKKQGAVTLEGWGQAMVLGAGSGPPGVWLACDRNLYAGGVALWLDDTWGPGITSAGVPLGSWFGDQAPTNITVSSWDEGLGVQYVKLLNEGKGVIAEERPNNCTGLYGSPCPTTRTSPFSGVTGKNKITGDSFGEGIRNSSVTVSDPTGKTAEKFFTTKVDNSKPEVALSGQLAEATGEVVSFTEGEKPVGNGEDKLRLPVYNLKIEAKDGIWGTTNDKDKRSGVKDIEVWLGDKGDYKELEVDWKPLSSCPATSCEKNVTYPLDLTKIDTAGSHKLKVIAKDFVGEEKVREIEFEYFPATGMKDEYVMHYFPLPDGQGDEDEEEDPARPELAVNVMNGNLVYREQDIDVDSTAGVDLEVERYYNSMLPATENTEWGDGWTLAQTPDLEPVDTGGSPAPDEAGLIDRSGALEEEVELPTEVGAQKFDPVLRASLEKRSTGGYELTDETGESATSVVFDATGQTEARLTEGDAKVDYDYEGGDLDEIAVEDPGTVSVSVEELEEAEAPGPEAPTYASAFGTNGSGDGQLKSPGDVAVDAQGNLWVVDRANNRIQKFSPQGSFLAKFGAYGTGDGQFNRPTAIAIAANGDLLVTDAGNARVQRFSSSGAYLSKFGAKGTGNGQFSGAGPEGIAIDASGNIWVSDTGAGRLQKFSSAGAFVKLVATKGSGAGQLGEPTAVAVDAGNNVWVTDSLNNRLSVFNNNGEFLSQVGSAGTGNGQFNRPNGIDIDSHGNVWVGDQNNRRVQQFDVAGQYKSKFGSAGAGPGQFEFALPMGIATDSNGHIWVTDVGNNRIQKWTIPGQPQFYSSYVSAFGANGSGNGQLKSPADVAVDAEGDLWVLDKANNRVQRFNPQGEYISQFGSAGSTDGKFSAPSAIAFDAEGNIWITDTGNNRLQKFNPKGEFLSKVGSLGSGNGQFKEPVGIAIAPSNGYIYVVDRGNNRVELFGKGGGYLGQAGTYGSGNSQLIEPSAIAIGPASGGSPFTLLIADSGNNRVQRWGYLGGYISQFGVKGPGGGQLDRPEAIDVDTQGDAWVGDRSNGRIQVFDVAGKYVDQVGAKGTGQGQFSFAAPMGIATFEGHAYVTDTGANRVQDWLGLRSTPSSEVAPTDDDPRVEVETPSGLVSSVEGDEAGTHTYTHVGDDLVAHEGPEGKAKYVNDSAGRMTKVTLPHGTWAEIDYEAAYGRVVEVRVSIEGGPVKATEFEYQDNPSRSTKVIPAGAPYIVYDIGDDGSVFKWWNEKKPPELDLGGALYDHREEDGFFWEGARLLEADAESVEGIASIQIIANGDMLVNEKLCPEPKVIECEKLESEWVTESDLHAPGHLQLEVIATDRNEESTSERFWVDVPKPTPLAPGTPVQPRFRDIAKFREEYGLEVVFPVANETELNERILDLIKAWNEPNTPAGQVARASMDRWGVPLRPADVAEMEYRERYIDENTELIEAWAEANYPGTYAGYYVDHRGGGLLHVGFVQDQGTRLADLKAQLSLEAEDRLAVYPNPPSTSLVSLASTYETLDIALNTNATLQSLVAELSISESGNEIAIGTTSVPQTQQIVGELVGSQIPIDIYPAAARIPASGRYRTSGQMRAGDGILNAKAQCTAAFGAFEERTQKSNGERITSRFVLTAGHCFSLNDYVHRSDRADFDEQEDWAPVGQVTRKALHGSQATDGLAIRAKIPDLVPHGIFGSDGNLVPTGSASKARVGNTLCYSGARLDGVSCGEVTRVSMAWEGALRVGEYNVRFNRRVDHGDSGAPVWNSRTGAAVGVVSAFYPGTQISTVAPLLHPKGLNLSRVPGILHHPDMFDMHLITGD